MSIPANKTIESVLLHNDEPPSNKYYAMQLVETDTGFVVNYRNWRAGTKGLQGSRTKKAVPYSEAKKLFDEILRKKTGEGRYKVIEQAGGELCRSDAEQTSSNHSVPASDTSGTTLPLASTGYLPQLLNPITRGECEELIHNDRFWAEQKVDGKRLLVGFINERGGVVGSNRRGEGVIVPPALPSAIKRPRKAFLDSSSPR